MYKMFCIILFFLGASICSFVTVVGYRIPKNKSILYPKSYCDSCHSKLSWLDKLPIIGYLKNFGKCHFCNKKINIFYLLNEIFFGMTFCLIIMTKVDFIPRISILLLILFFSVTDQLYGIIIPIFFIPELFFIFFIGIKLHFYSFIILLTILSIFSYVTKGLGFGDVEIFSFFALIFSLKKALLIIIISCLLCLIIEAVQQNFDKKITLVPYIYMALIIIFLVK